MNEKELEEFRKEHDLLLASQYCKEMRRYEEYMWHYIFCAVVGEELMAAVIKEAS